MIFSGKKYLTAVNNRMTVGKTVNMTVKNNPFSYQIGIFKIIASFYIIAYVISDDYFIRITGQIYVGQHIHFTL